jgi:hypothetical protein
MPESPPMSLDRAECNCFALRQAARRAVAETWERYPADESLT